ncbi:hypothetical protein N431DRAFT_430167 [Stipitochalara longipes BDJ]|nr:hypothetical protein N431DRAFT_430167 [Stipitochalara longipes BDJ]
MAPKAFHRFPKLPIELRLRIWNLTMEPRVIKAKWDNEFTARSVCQFYFLTAGPSPKALHACKESREEAKRKYCFVKSHLPFRDRVIHHHRPWEQKAIWINFDIDTLYFVNFPTTEDFLSYMRRLSKEKIGGANQNIKYIAIPASVLDRLKAPRPGLPNRLLFFYRLVLDQPSLEKIIIMLDNSKFEDEKRPENYSLSRPSFLENGRGGGRWGSKQVRRQMNLLFDEFFINPKVEGQVVESFRKFKDNNPDWALPNFIQLSITKKPKHGYTGDGLPINRIPKKRAAPKPKPVKAVLKTMETVVARVQALKSK